MLTDNITTERIYSLMLPLLVRNENTLVMVCCTSRVDSQTPQDSPGSPRIPDDSMAGSHRRGGRAIYVCDHPLSKSGDDLVTLANPTTMGPALWAERG